MSRASIIRTGVAALSAVLTLAAGAAAAQAPGAVQSAFVVLGDGGRAVARVVTTASACPSLDTARGPLPMIVRAAPGVVPQRPTRSRPEESKASAFPVLVCEARLPEGSGRVTVEGRRLPAPVAEHRRIVVIGDTGCRIKTSDRAFQACKDAGEYPFAQVAASAAAWKPDLVIHVGDMLYRENACPEDKPGCAGSVWGYGWDAWDADFFTPGAALLSAAPWVMVRGNHESCDRGGQGWWRILDPRPLVPGRDCNEAANDRIGDYSDPYAVPLGRGAQVVVLDTAKAANSPLPPEDYAGAQYRDAWSRLDGLTRQAPYTIVAHHHPLLGYAALAGPDGKRILAPGNLSLQSVFGRETPQLFPGSVKMSLAGHVHVWEQLSFSSAHPTQFISGFSGTQEDIVPLPRTLAGAPPVAPGAIPEAFSSWVDGFGFMTLERTGSDAWSVQVRDIYGRVVNRCRVKGRHSACDTPQVTAPARP